MRHAGQRAIFCPLPLFEGVSTTSGAPWRSRTRSDSIIALSANDAPVSRWHQRQWQQCTKSGRVVMRYRTARHVQPPSNVTEGSSLMPSCLSSRACSPALEARPRRVASRRIHRVILAELRARRASMIGQDAELGADRKARDDVVVLRARARDDAVLLVRGCDDVARERLAYARAHLA